MTSRQAFPHTRAYSRNLDTGGSRVSGLAPSGGLTAPQPAATGLAQTISVLA